MTMARILGSFSAVLISFCAPDIALGAPIQFQGTVSKNGYESASVPDYSDVFYYRYVLKTETTITVEPNGTQANVSAVIHADTTVDPHGTNYHAELHYTGTATIAPFAHGSYQSVPLTLHQTKRVGEHLKFGHVDVEGDFLIENLRIDTTLVYNGSWFFALQGPANYGRFDDIFQMGWPDPYGRDVFSAGGWPVDWWAWGGYRFSFTAAAARISYARLALDTDASNPDTGVDTALEPTTSVPRLSQLPSITEGLVADGVTPLIIKIDPQAFTNSSNQTGSVRLSFDPPTGGSIAGGIDSRFYVLETSGWALNANAPHSVSAAADGVGYAYISAIKPEDLTFDEGATEISVTIRTDSSSESPVPSGTIKIRRPPIVLVHGYNSNADSWTTDFRSELYRSENPSFVVSVDYGPEEGVIPTLPGQRPKRATYGSLADLALDLDQTLITEIENKDLGRFKDWAWTRYNVVAHSQGGVLIRMLCTKSSPLSVGNDHPFSMRPFRSADNFMRGRFYRIVTLGSPQNGSVYPYYLNRLSLSRDYFFLPLVLKGVGILQDKFDPFAPQGDIHQINHPGTLVDPGAQFHVLRGLIGSGKPEPGLFPLAYSLSGLTAYLPSKNDTRGSIVLPQGSDGVVDTESASVGREGEGATVSTLPNTSHSGPLFFFGAEKSETGSSGSGAVVRGIINGATSKFSSFEIPALASEARKKDIDSVIPQMHIADIISSLPFFRSSRVGRYPASPEGQMVFNYVAAPDPSYIMQMGFMWHIEVIGPAGVTTAGVTVTADPNDTANATVTVDDAVTGDVVLYASYFSDEGDLVVGKPKIVTSRPVGSSIIGIELLPSELQLRQGSVAMLSVWGIYDNGQKAQLYISYDAPAEISSSNATIASVDQNLILRAHDPGIAKITASYKGFTTETAISVVPASVTASSRLANISTRLKVGRDDSVLIGGFIITGSAAKRVIIRGIGPSTNIPGALANPTLELFDASSNPMVSNDDWRSNQAEVEATTIPPTNDLESAIVTTLAPGSYTAILRGLNDTTGIGVVEAYDLDGAANSTLANISSRGFVDTGDNAMIGGFIVDGHGGGTRVLVRGIGSSLASFFPNALANPTLELRNADGSLIRENDNWRDSQEGDIQATTIPPSNNLESAIIATVSNGSYTAILRGAGNTTGVAVVEVYNLR